MREQRLVFGEVAERYDRVRPSYPDALVDDVLACVGRDRTVRLLEVGAGTGKASVMFAERGVQIDALEPSREMASRARRNLARFPHVRVIQASLEGWHGQSSSFDVVCAAQSWHWVDPDARLPKVHAALRDGGVLALFWNCSGWGDSPVERAVDAAYDTWAPDVLARTPGRVEQHDAQALGIEQLRKSPLFADVHTLVHPWRASYDAADYVELLRTSSTHRMLAPEVRANLLRDIGAAIDAAGGRIDVDYTAELTLGRRA